MKEKLSIWVQMQVGGVHMVVAVYVGVHFSELFFQKQDSKSSAESEVGFEETGAQSHLGNCMNDWTREM